MVFEVSDDLALDVASALARRGTACARAACCRTTPGALRRRRRFAIMALTELGDLAIKPRKTLLHVRTLSFERVNDLLHPRQRDPLVRGRKLKRTPERLRWMNDLRHAGG